ncbi:hypothetical protein ACIQY8_30190 [Streptomyces albidoflavus]
MARDTAPRCHGRRMTYDHRTRQWVCGTCGAWTTRTAPAMTGGAR